MTKSEMHKEIQNHKLRSIGLLHPKVEKPDRKIEFMKMSKTSSYKSNSTSSKSRMHENIMRDKMRNIGL